MISSGGYPSAEAVLTDAVQILLRERERRRLETLLDETGFDEKRIEQLLQEAEDNGDYTEMTAQDWEDIEREGLAIVNARKSA